MWNKLKVSLEKSKFLYFAGALLVCILFLGMGKASALNDGLTYNGYHWYPNHGPVAGSTGYNYISNNVYMQLAISRDGYTDITRTNLKVYSTSTYISVEVFGAHLCSNQPSYTTDEFFTSSRSSMTSTFSLSRATDELTRIGVTTTTAAYVSDSVTTRYKGTCTADTAKEVLYARSNVYDQTLGMYVFNFEARAGAASDFVNGFRVRALRAATSSTGIFISADPGNSPDQFGIETAYPRDDNGNAGASTTYADYSVPFVPDCEMTTTTTKRITLFDDDNASSSIQTSRKFRVKVVRTDGTDTNIPFSSFGGNAGYTVSPPAADGYYTITGANGGDRSTTFLNFSMVPGATYMFMVDNLYQNNTLQISIPTTTSPNKRVCPGLATLDGVKIDDATGVVPYGGNPGTPATVPYNNLRTQVSSTSGTANPFTYTNAVSVTSLSGTNATVSVANLPAGSGWVLRGHSICQSSLPTCTSAYLTNPANIVGPGLQSFSHKFMSGTRYSMRWIYTRASATDCIVPPIYDPAFPEPWQPFDLTAGIQYDNASYVPLNPRIALTIRDSATSAIVYPTNTQTPTKNGTDATFTFTSINLSAYPVGNYEATWEYTDSATAPVTCRDTFYLGNKPYFNVLGGDTMVGDPAKVDSMLQSWNNDNYKALAYGGAGSQLAALTSGDTRSFATGRNIFNGPNLPDSLAFANTTAVIPSALYGGKYQELPNRINYYASNIAKATPRADTDIDIATLASGIYSFEGDVTVRGTLQAGRDVKILSAGNVFISGAILGYNYNALNNIPRLGIYTQDGNILISQNTTEIHGTFATGPGGKFYSCTLDATKTPVENDDTGAQYAACVGGLKIYGSVSADELVLSRTKDSLRQPNSEPAESFIYSPEVWLGAPADFTVNSYIGLPPVL